MTAAAILSTAMEHAIKNGWNNGFYLHQSAGELLFNDLHYRLIFDHDFAKALWGEAHMLPEWYLENGDQVHWTTWKWRLMEMVLADDPLIYLEEHLPK